MRRSIWAAASPSPPLEAVAAAGPPACRAYACRAAHCGPRSPQAPSIAASAGPCPPPPDPQAVHSARC
eukprot:8524951-Lingulodinium_polyedra.AAC.1